ncbi:MAG: SAM-dependent methyltransferase [Aestuariivita sp.]|nr:SAM-dependent methyltransferase [Aestuariivita sp.]MCY4345812.1 SAM-dependent methyltransferase [Aestuariivita sp.]
MTLSDLLSQRILSDGPLSIADYMAECLSNPQYGYYATQEPFGVSGDFITAPEISQMFGELLGLCLAQCWIDQGKPKSITLAEAGPGRGTLMADALRATQIIPEFHTALKLFLIETSERLRNIQAQTLRDYTPQWISATDELPQQPLFFLANEFFDALPIRQFQRQADYWRERRVNFAENQFFFEPDVPTVQPLLDHRINATVDGDIVEVCPAALPVIHNVSGRIAQYGGAALIVDYGNWRSLGDTLQAVQNHKMVPPLSTPGRVDLTAHVDFGALVRAAVCQHSKLVPQGLFLQRLGIVDRARKLTQSATIAQATEVKQALHRLTHHDQLGTHFKVLGLFPHGEASPLGLD